MQLLRIIPLMVLAAGCSSREPEPIACTMIGCESGLSVVVQSSAQTELTVKVSSNGTTLHTFTCRAGEPCQAFIANQTPANVSVAVTSAAGTATREYTPEYRMNRPNGPDCPPECKQATVTVNVS